jgi:hypothetical protein
VAEGLIYYWLYRMRRGKCDRLPPHTAAHLASSYCYMCVLIPHAGSAVANVTDSLFRGVEAAFFAFENSREARLESYRNSVSYEADPAAEAAAAAAARGAWGSGRERVAWGHRGGKLWLSSRRAGVYVEEGCRELRGPCAAQEVASAEERLRRLMELRLPLRFKEAFLDKLQDACSRGDEQAKLYAPLLEP